MPPFLSTIGQHQPHPCPAFGVLKHPDVPLLAHMAIRVCAETFARSGQLQSRVECFEIALGHVNSHLWPLTHVLPTALTKQSVFLGGEPFKPGSLRKWVGDLHGIVLAQRLRAGELPPRRKHADSCAKAIQKDAQAHLLHLIAEVANDASGRPTPLIITALEQLQKELF